MNRSGTVHSLEGLRAWHLPEPVSWWPPAPGWWVTAALVLLLLGSLVWWGFRRHRERAVARAAHRELQGLRGAFKTSGDSLSYIRGLSRLLRRFAIARYPRRRVAGLTGGDWLSFLDEKGGKGRFGNGIGRVLVDAPYRPYGEIPADEIADLVKDWIAQNARPRS